MNKRLIRILTFYSTAIYATSLTLSQCTVWCWESLWLWVLSHQHKSLTLVLNQFVTYCTHFCIFQVLLVIQSSLLVKWIYYIICINCRSVIIHPDLHQPVHWSVVRQSNLLLDYSEIQPHCSSAKTISCHSTNICSTLSHSKLSVKNQMVL